MCLILFKDLDTVTLSLQGCWMFLKRIGSVSQNGIGFGLVFSRTILDSFGFFKDRLQNRVLDGYSVLIRIGSVFRMDGEVSEVRFVASSTSQK